MVCIIWLLHEPITVYIVQCTVQGRQGMEEDDFQEKTTGSRAVWPYTVHELYIMVFPKNFIRKKYIQREKKGQKGMTWYLLSTHYTLYRNSSWNKMGPKASLIIIPDFARSVYGSSCNFLIFAPLLSLPTYWHPQGSMECQDLGR